MASQLMALRQQVSALSGDAESMAGALAMLKSRFGSTAAQVLGAIGGSSQQTDRTIVAALQAAEKELDTAIAALQYAAGEGKRYAGSL
jgi:hypothetical protein